MTARPALRLATLALAASLAAACARTDDKPAKEAPAVSTEASSEGSMVRLTLDRDVATPADRLTLRIERVAAPGWAPVDGGAMPSAGERLGEFTVAEVRRAPSTFDDQGRRVDAVEFVLLPFLPGEEQVPALEWTFAALPGAVPDPAPQPVVVRTEPVVVTVTSLLDDQTAGLAETKGVADAPPAPRWPWIAGGAGAIALLAGAAVLLRRRAVEREASRPPTPAHEEALAALEALARLHLPEQRAFDPYFTELSRILRRYIERRFEVHAPTLTTDEFLQKARSSRVIRAEFVRDLEAFLRLADLVKFARHAPLVDEAGRAHDTARAFIESTAAPVAPPTSPTEAAA